MVMLKSLFLAGLVLTSAFAQESKPTMATLQVKPNFDFGLTSKEFRVHYSGVGEAFTSENAIINIYKSGVENAVLSYTVDDNKKNDNQAYYFALKDAEDGKYEVEVCAGSNCSGKTSALTEITGNKNHKLTCEEGTKDEDGTWNKIEDFELNFMGPLDQDWMTDTTEFATIESTFNDLIKQAGLKTVYKTDYNSLGLTKNPTYKNTATNGRVFYAALKYDVGQYRRLFDKKRSVETRSKYAHDYCKRKYLLTANAHLVKKDTNVVEYRFKTTLQLSGLGKQYFILADEAADGRRKVHVEMTHKNVEIADGTYKLHVTFCATEKDQVDSTFCADPIVHSEDFVVTNSEFV